MSIKKKGKLVVLIGAVAALAASLINDKKNKETTEKKDLFERRCQTSRARSKMEEEQDKIFCVSDLQYKSTVIASVFHQTTYKFIVLLFVIASVFHFTFKCVEKLQASKCSVKRSNPDVQHVSIFFKGLIYLISQKQIICNKV